MAVFCFQHSHPLNALTPKEGKQC